MKIVRNISFLCVLAICVSGSLFAQSAQTDVALQAQQVTEFEVNGLKVLVKRRASTPTVAAGLFVRGGSRNITADNAGIESMMLNVASEASKKYPKEEVRRELARTGSGIVAGSNRDYSVFSLATTRDSFDGSWDLFTDLFINPAFKSEDLERLRANTMTAFAGTGK